MHVTKLKVHLSDPGMRTKGEDLVLVVSVECGGKHGVVEIPFGVIAVQGTLFPKESPEEILKRALRDKIEDWAREQGLLPPLKEVTLKVTERLLEVLKGIKEVEVGR